MVRNVVLREDLFNNPALEVCSVQDRNILVGKALPVYQVHYFVYYRQGFTLFRG